MQQLTSNFTTEFDLKAKKTLNWTRQENDNKKEHKSKSIDILGVWSIRFDFKWHNEIGGNTTWLKQTRTKNSAKQHEYHA